jgi:GNAT superfamily N-acetyltransferase
MHIRSATDNDESASSRIYLACRIETFHWIQKNEFALQDFKRDTEGEVIFVAVEDETIVGFASIWAKDNFLHHLFVDSKYQGQGVGKGLLAHCLGTILKRPARLKCVIRNERACRFYERQGWKIESTTADGPMGPYHTYVLQ